MINRQVFYLTVYHVPVIDLKLNMYQLMGLSQQPHSKGEKTEAQGRANNSSTITQLETEPWEFGF